MTHVCCPSCRLRFTRASVAHLVTCPHCGEPPHVVRSATSLLGYRLVSEPPLSVDLARPDAVAVALPVPQPGDRS